MLACPFCGSAETERLSIEGERFIVFACMFTPRVSPELNDAQIEEEIRRSYGTNGSAYFRGICDRLHLVVARDERLKSSPTS